MGSRMKLNKIDVLYLLLFAVTAATVIWLGKSGTVGWLESILNITFGWILLLLFIGAIFELAWRMHKTILTR